MISIEQILRCITASRGDFARIFMRAQYNAGIPVDERVEFEAVAREPDDKKAFRLGLEHSKRKRGMYNALVRLIISRKLEGGVLSRFLIENNAQLQAITDVHKGVDDPLLLSSGIIDGYNWTGKVLVGGEAMGTGVLIGHKRFLTAWHVIHQMFELDLLSNPARYVPKKAPPALQVSFEDYCQSIERGRRNNKRAPKTIVIDAAEDWLEIFSNCHEDELQDLVPQPPNLLKGFLDYAIIRLANAPDDERNYAEVDKRALVPDNMEEIIAFQYMNGKGLVVGRDKITMPGTAYTGIDDLRFLHYVNADHGSSGAPCFDKDFYLVGIHQGKWPEEIGGKKVNRGVPIRSIVLDIEEKLSAASGNGKVDISDPREEHFVWYLDKIKYEPVIGIDDFQFLILKNVQIGKGSILSIQGDKKSGKTYCISTLFSLLCNGEHLKLWLPGDVISKMDCITLAKYICSAAGAELKQLTSLQEYNSTTAAWLRDEVVPKVLSHLQDKRGNRNVWICISNLNVYDIEGKNAADFLLLLYDGVRQNNWLHFVLDGLRTDLPAHLSVEHQQYTAKPKKLEDIRKYIQRFILELNIKNAPPEMMDEFAQFIFEAYTDKLATSKEEAMSFLRDKCKGFFDRLINKLSK